MVSGLLMNNKKTCLLLLFLMLLVLFSSEIDIVISRLFYNDGLFYLHDGWLAWMVRLGFPLLLVASGMMFFALWFWGWSHGKNWVGGIDTKVMFLVTGSMVLIVGVVVNGIFKTFWGRARPIDVVEFGGDKIFTPPLMISNQCNYDCSFMSGHAAIGFWVVCFAFLAPKKHRKMAIAGAIIFGSLLGLARIAEGLHFFSDVVFAGVVTVSGVWWMYKKIIN